MITAVVTSHDRHDLLSRTLDSFFHFDTYPVTAVIVVEDGPDIAPEEVQARFEHQPIVWISTGRNVGQIAAIDYAYSRVTTPYVFHLEDDWEFYRPGFIEPSLTVLESNPKCLQVWLRAVGDTQRHPVEPHVYVDHGVPWRRMALQYSHKGDWHGFSFNPGLRRMRDYIAIGGYGANVRFEADRPGAAESAISTLYRSRDYFAAILADDDGSGYVHHIGVDRHVGPTGDHAS